MPTTFIEQNQQFTFDDTWRVVKLDKGLFFTEKLMPLQLTGAVDFLGLRGSELYFIEVKDYRGSRIELKNAEKMHEGDNLFLQVARKAKDSVACIVGAARTLPDTFWRDCAEVMRKRHLLVNVVFWLEFDLARPRPGGNATFVQQHTRIEATTRANQLKAKLGWLTRQVTVTNHTITLAELPGVAVVDVGRTGFR